MLGIRVWGVLRGAGVWRAAALPIACCVRLAAEVAPGACLEAAGSIGHAGGALPTGLCLPGFAYRVHFASVEEGAHYA